MAKTRPGRIKYYNIFSYVYDLFINLHSGKDKGTTRSFLIDCAVSIKEEHPRILDLCCGTGSVLIGFMERIQSEIAVGCDFSRGMLQRASIKSGKSCNWVESDVTQLPFDDSSFEIITCSHALYELKGQHRKTALMEMRRVVKPDGVVLIMEHEVPIRPLIRFFFNMRMAAMGSEDAAEFVKAGEKPFRAIFSEVQTAHTPSGKSKVFKCKK